VRTGSNQQEQGPWRYWVLGDNFIIEHNYVNDIGASGISQQGNSRGGIIHFNTIEIGNSPHYKRKILFTCVVH
jgi:hypothetical protein